MRPIDSPRSRHGTRRRWLLRASVVLLAPIAYSVVRAWTFEFTHLPPIPGGLSSLTVLLTLFSLSHAWYSIGGRLTAVFFAISAVVSWALEQAGVATGLVYGGYHYTDYLGAKLFDVPILIPLAWFMMIYPSYVIANLALTRRPVGTPPGATWLVTLAAASALTMTVWDLVVDPILSGPEVRAWVWESGGQYFGVPIQNFFGWFVTTFIVYGLFRALEQRASDPSAPSVDRRAGALPVAAYGLMLLGDLASGVTPAGIFLIGPIVMGVPFAIGAWSLRYVPAVDARRLHETVAQESSLEFLGDGRGEPRREPIDQAGE
jgi:uncharacterized membrane protein